MESFGACQYLKSTNGFIGCISNSKIINLDTVINHSDDHVIFPETPENIPWLVTGLLQSTVPWNPLCAEEVFTAECQNCNLLREIRKMFQADEIRTTKMVNSDENTISVSFEMSLLNHEHETEPFREILNELISEYMTIIFVPEQNAANWTLSDQTQIEYKLERYRISDKIAINEPNGPNINCIEDPGPCGQANEAITAILKNYDCAFKVSDVLTLRYSCYYRFAIADINVTL